MVDVEKLLMGTFPLLERLASVALEGNVRSCPLSGSDSDTSFQNGFHSPTSPPAISPQVVPSGSRASYTLVGSVGV